MRLGLQSLRFRLQKGFWTSAWGLGLLSCVALFFLTAAGVFTFYYIKYARMIDARLSGHFLQNTTQIFSAPEHISDGQEAGAPGLNWSASTNVPVSPALNVMFVLVDVSNAAVPVGTIPVFQLAPLLKSPVPGVGSQVAFWARAS